MTADIAGREWSRTLRRRGAVVLAPFALAWAAVGASGLPSSGAWAVRIGAVAVSAAVVALALRSGGREVDERSRRQPDGWRRRVGVVNAAQFALIAVVVVLLIVVDAPELVPPLVCLVEQPCQR